MNQQEIDAYWLGCACSVAEGSPDPSTKNGAVLLPLHPRDQWACAANRPVCGKPRLASLDLTIRETKLHWTEHAERGAIFKAIRNRLDPVGGTLYCPFAACAECARAICGCGVIRLVRLPESVLPRPDDWRASVEAGDAIMRENGVEIVDYDGPPLRRAFFLRGKTYEV